jgi:hypothetical protein
MTIGMQSKLIIPATALIAPRRLVCQGQKRSRLSGVNIAMPATRISHCAGQRAKVTIHRRKTTIGGSWREARGTFRNGSPSSGDAMRGMMKLGRCAVLLLCVVISLRPNAAQAIGQECMAMYYRSRSPACIDGMLAEFRQRPRSDLNTLIGFLAQIFRTSERNASAS